MEQAYPSSLFLLQLQILPQTLLLGNEDQCEQRVKLSQSLPTFIQQNLVAVLSVP